MNRRDVLTVLGSGCVIAAAGTTPAMPEDRPSPKDARPDLSKFPKLTGKVKQMLGHSFGYITPVAGDPFHLDLTDTAKLTALQFNPKTESYIPLPGPIAVESVRYSSNGGHFENMRFISRSKDPVLADHIVTIDILPAQVWVVIQSRGVVTGVALIDTEYEGAFPKRVE